ncbi:MAG TPA: AAA domain-containing protein [Burkholderiales bacterium]|nr:AAA domain-containing protein [Burkholderiales bacterium]
MSQEPETGPLAERILAALKAKPGQKASELATALFVDRSEINSLLQGKLKGLCIQDSKYHWRLTGDTSKSQAADTPQFADTPLSRLCRYYLACVGYEDEGEVSVFASSTYNDSDYVELRSFLGNTNSDIFRSEEAQRLIGKMRKDRSRQAMHLGYPIALWKQTSKSGERFKVEPIILYPVEFENGVTPRISSAFPLLNLSVLRRFTNAQRDAVMDELAQLEEELGLSGDIELPDVDELCRRLATIRPEWPWTEPPDPGALTSDPPLSRVNAEGIYNRAILVITQRSPFTEGLEAELKLLSRCSVEKYAGTALGHWISGVTPDQAQDSVQTLIEVLPLNQEQRQAIEHAFSSPLTIITGPPGTGKSQVVADLLINSVWRGKRVLFASKNNKAVDVVEERLNNGPRPIVLRVGANQYQAKLTEYLIGLLAAKAGPDDQSDFDDALKRHQAIEERLVDLAKEEAALIEMRNRTDGLEQEVEDSRATFGVILFAALREFDADRAERAVLHFVEAHVAAVREEQTFLARLFWPLSKNRRYDRISVLATEMRWLWDALGLQVPAAIPDDESIKLWTRFSELVLDHLRRAMKVQDYFRGIASLQRSRSLEAIARARAGYVQGLAENSKELWYAWLRVQPTRLSPADRQLLIKHNAVLAMVMEAGPEAAPNDQVRRQYFELFPKIAHLLPCWAVTSLSARGRIPFEPGFFDLVVFDEASQCDIASALPLLYRAKSAVVIGDPQQLSHISGLQKGQDQQLLGKFGLLEEFPHWAYSYRSLFDLSCGFASSDGIVALRDHHRSHSDIIQFSNDWFYEGALRVATSYELLKRPDPKAPGVRWVEIAGEVRRPPAGGAVNVREAQMVVEELKRLLVEMDYVGTVGVVSPFREQANLIRELASKDSSLAEKLQRVGFLAETVHRFQGDQRDVMIFSPVVSRNMPRGAIVFLKKNGNLFNVAITRARALLIVVGDRDAAASSDVEYLAAFSRYVQEIGVVRESEEEVIEPCGLAYPVVANPEQVSDWERLLYTKLYQAGIQTLPQYVVEKYRLDLAIVEGDRRLDIEVDGERYHRNWTGELCRRDQIRNQRMFELGWDVLRFWVYEVRDDMDGCIRRVNEWKTRIRSI